MLGRETSNRWPARRLERAKIAFEQGQSLLANNLLAEAKRAACADSLQPHVSSSGSPREVMNARPLGLHLGACMLTDRAIDGLGTRTAR